MTGGNFHSSNNIEYETNKTPIIEEYLYKVRPYLKVIIYNLNETDT